MRTWIKGSLPRKATIVAVAEGSCGLLSLITATCEHPRQPQRWPETGAQARTTAGRARTCRLCMSSPPARTGPVPQTLGRTAALQHMRAQDGTWRLAVKVDARKLEPSHELRLDERQAFQQRLAHWSVQELLRTQHGRACRLCMCLGGAEVVKRATARGQHLVHDLGQHAEHARGVRRPGRLPRQAQERVGCAGRECPLVRAKAQVDAGVVGALDRRVTCVASQLGVPALF